MPPAPPNLLAMETSAIHMDPTALEAGTLRRGLSAVSGMLVDLLQANALLEQNLKAASELASRFKDVHSDSASAAAPNPPSP